MNQNVYLKNMPLNDAQTLLYKHCSINLKTEVIPVRESLYRITSEPVIALASSPIYTASAMDGIAVIARSTEEATESNPIKLSDDQFMYVNTGNPIEDPFDAVIKIEDLIEKSKRSVTLIKSASPYQNIRPIGEDIVEKTPIIPKYHSIRPIDIAAMLAGGITEVNVTKKPKVIVIPTGDEIIRNPHDLRVGKILDSNSFYLENALKTLNVDVHIHEIVKDDITLLESAILNAVTSHDLVLVGAGSSAGTKDFVKTIVEKHGSVYVHGVAIKPGKPTLIGVIKTTPVIGMPGYPVSTFMAFELFVKPLIQYAMHQHLIEPTLVKATLTKRLYTSLDSTEFVRVKLNKVGKTLTATPLNRGAGITTSIVQADGLFIVPKDKEGFEANEVGDVWLLRALDDIDQTLTVIGSHDILLDEIDAFFRDSGYKLSSTHVGSFGGVMAIKSNECHLAPIHLIDDNGNYNHYILSKYLDNNYVLIRGVGRVQGLYTKPNNPKNIRSIHDLETKNLRFVNRQRGSGTRLFFDYILKQEKITSTTIEGYHYELPTHTMVASAVKNGNYDTGLGIQSVANLYQLPFIKVGVEHYDFIVHKTHLDTPKIKHFIKVLKSTEFHLRLQSIGGYTMDGIGEILTDKD